MSTKKCILCFASFLSMLAFVTSFASILKDEQGTGLFLLHFNAERFSTLDILLEAVPLNVKAYPR